MTAVDLSGGVETGRIRDRILVLLFAVLIALPATLHLAGVAQSTAERERRTLAELPRFPDSTERWRSFPSQIDSYLADRFGLRPALLAAASRLKFGLRMPAGALVFTGKDGWLYYNGNQQIDQHTGLRLFGPDEIALWLASLESYRRWLADRGISFVFVIAPDKPSIYPEHLPDGIKLAAVTPADQLLAAIAAQGRIDAADLRPALRAVKSAGDLYYKTDLHWNGIGAYFGLQAVMKGRWPSGVALPPLSDYRVESHPFVGDLNQIANLPCCSFEQELTLALKSGSAVVAQGRDLAPGTPNAWIESRHKTYPSVFIFGDSFATYWAKILPDVTRRTVYLRHEIPFPTAIIEREKPDIVIYEVIQEYMFHVPKPLARP
jgi:hypothetical protein